MASCSRRAYDHHWIGIGGGSVVTLAGSQFEPRGIAIDSTSVYWVNNGSAVIMKAPLDGGAPVTLTTAQNSVLAIAVDETSVYWATEGAVMKATPK